MKHSNLIAISGKDIVAQIIQYLVHKSKYPDTEMVTLKDFLEDTKEWAVCKRCFI